MRARRPSSRRPGDRLEPRLERPRVPAEAVLELDRRLADIAEGSAGALEGAGDEDEALLEVVAPRRLLAGRVRRDAAQLLAGARRDVGQLALPPPELLDAGEESAALA